MKVFALLFVFIFSASCSMMKSKIQNEVERTVASIEPNQLKVDEMEGSYFVSINFEVDNKTKGDNTFVVKAPYNLSDSFNSDLVYDIYINSSDVSCFAGSLNEISKNNQYRAKGFIYHNELRCLYEGMEDKKLVSVTYVFPKINYIPIQEANSFVQPVNASAKDAARILRSVKNGEKVSLYDDKLLFNVFGEKRTISLKAKEYGVYPFKLKMNKNDVVKISAPRGSLDVPKLGSIGYHGMGSAGRKSLVRNHGIANYELFCKVHNNGRRSPSYIRFNRVNEMEFSNIKYVHCALNTKKISKGKLKNITGEIKLDVSIVRYESLEDKINQYLEEPQEKLNEFVDHLNEGNLSKVKSIAQETIDLQVKEVEAQEEISKVFPFTVEKDFQIKEMSLIHYPKVSKVIHDEQIYYYLDYDIYADPVVVNPQDGSLLRPGGTLLGSIQTKTQIKKSQDLSEFEIYKNICGKVYQDTYMPYFMDISKTKEEAEKVPVELSDYKEYIQQHSDSQCESEEDYSSPLTLTLKRAFLKKCGDISTYHKVIARSVEKKAQVEFNTIEAHYDLFEATHSSWDLYYYKLYRKIAPMKKSQIIKTKHSVEEVQGCEMINKEKAIELLR